MSESLNNAIQNRPSIIDLHFDEEIEIEGSGFSFRSISGFKLEIDCSVYMYSEDGNFEISLNGGKLENNTSIAELNDTLAAKFMVNVGDFELIESGIDVIQGITGFQNEIRFVNAEEEKGFGRVLICSPFINQYFFILVIASAEYWQNQGDQVFDALKAHISFHPQFKPDIIDTTIDRHPDLTIETYADITPDEDFVLKIEKGDISFLLAARSYSSDEVISITEIKAPGGKQLYHYNPDTGAVSSTISDQPLMGASGEVCFFYPRTNQQSLQIGEYLFSFATESGKALQEIQVIVRTGRALDLQTVDLNFWLAIQNGSLFELNAVEQFTSDIYEALKKQMAPLNLSPGKIECFHPAPDELGAFSSVHLESDLADCSYMIAESVNNSRALNIGLVDNLTQGYPPELSEVNAVSSGSPGMILADASPHACILVNWTKFKDNLHGLADAIIHQLIVFSGIETKDIVQQGNELLLPNHEIAWRLRLHPIFYEAD